MIFVSDIYSINFKSLKLSLKEKNEMIKSSLKVLLIITLMIVFSSSLNAECTKDEILKLINAGYNKTEISALCGNKDGYKSISKFTPGDIWTDPVSGMEFVFVQGGCYKMGSDSGDRDETPVHEVCVDDFWMGKYEVTKGQWNKIMDINPSVYLSGDNFPVENVSWFVVKKFILLFNDLHTGRIFSLPTEAQWEYAARSGGKNEKMLGENDFARIAWYSENSLGISFGPHRIGSKNPNGLGIYDMNGNVWEWCEDTYNEDAYSMHTHSNPLLTSGGRSHVKRGGGFGNEVSYLRSENRGQLSASFGRGDLGFRLCFSQVQQ
jgi:formylglycine-generating enzyme required for sulfatase activity